MNPLITVIVPVYNIKKYVNKCLNSIKKQTYSNLEIIIIDDGSNDGSEAACDHYCKDDKRARVFHTKNQGLSAARNLGIKKSSGELVVFIDGDDYVTPTYVEDLYHVLDKYQADIAICSFTEKSPNGEKKWTNNRHHESILTPETCIEKMFLEDGFNASACGKLFSRKLLKYLHFPEGKLHEDIGATYLPILHSTLIAFTPKTNYIYMQRPTSITHIFSKEKLDLIKLTDNACDEIDNAFPNLKNITNLRRMQARFSILRQLPKTEHDIATELSNYLKQNRAYILNNPKARKRDILAILSLLLGMSFFRFAWKTYETFFK